ncbi:MAG TPA: MFS transporter [Thermoanaerobaculia bacterium]|nr:MFS transporter [Thermoanaerobaculia bacterium]
MSRPETDPAGGSVAAEIAGPVSGTSALSRTFHAFTYRDYRLLWAGAFTSSVGTWMQEVAQNWLILTMTGSAFLLGLDAFLGDAPFLAFSLFGGVLADRVDRRRILLGSQLVQLTSAFLLAGLIWGHAVQVWIILTLSFVVGFAQSFGGPAYQALIPTLVDKKDIGNAITLNSIQFNLARVIGPVLAGIAFYKLGAAACFGLNGLSFLAVIVALLALKRGALDRPPGTPEPFRESLKTGLRAVRDAKPLRGLIALSFVGSFCAMPLVTFLPVFAREVFHRDAKGYSVLLAAFGIGAVAGAVGIAGFVQRFPHKGVLAVAMQMTFGALTVGFALSRTPALSYALLLLAGAALMIVFAMFMTLVQSNVDDRLRGRVVSVYSLAFRGAMPLGNLTAGVLASFLGAPRVLILDGAVLMAMGSFVLLRHARSGVTSL